MGTNNLKAARVAFLTKNKQQIRIKQMRMINLVEEVTYCTNGSKGGLLAMQVSAGDPHGHWYYFQPKAIKPTAAQVQKLKTGRKGKKGKKNKLAAGDLAIPEPFWIGEESIDGQTVEVPDLPLNLLGTMVKDKITGFEGKVECITIHCSGCLHFVVQPVELAENGGRREPMDLSIRRLTGKELDEMWELAKPGMTPEDALRGEGLREAAPSPSYSGMPTRFGYGTTID